MVRDITAAQAKELSTYYQDYERVMFDTTVNYNARECRFCAYWQEPKETILKLCEIAVERGFQVLYCEQLHADSPLGYWRLKIEWDK